MRVVLRFLRASIDRSWDSTGRVDLVAGALVYLIGRAVNVDLGLATVAIVLGWFALRVLLITPARMWDESRKANGGGSIVVESGGTYVNAPGAIFTLGGPARRRSRSDAPEQGVLWKIEQDEPK